MLNEYVGLNLKVLLALLVQALGLNDNQHPKSKDLEIRTVIRDIMMHCMTLNEDVHSS